MTMKTVATVYGTEKKTIAGYVQTLIPIVTVATQNILRPVMILKREDQNHDFL